MGAFHCEKGKEARTWTGTDFGKSEGCQVERRGFVRIEIVVAPLIEKDSEVVSYSKSARKNDELIALHLDKWVREPYEVVGSRVGCEINFNRIFPARCERRHGELP
ncbi:hypothetical protein BZM27_55080 [Paraburkholderia steynii]|uniref:Uncharacterized protein n=1 Tax=Paraburkholderia steynii TaxID=1245441 RepID=A0A4R0WZX3_9BURK|nr:hypothetical protein BZM27_55080 [Paraburkholderia steynii]